MFWKLLMLLLQNHTHTHIYIWIYIYNKYTYEFIFHWCATILFWIYQITCLMSSIITIILQPHSSILYIYISSNPGQPVARHVPRLCHQGRSTNWRVATFSLPQSRLFDLLTLLIPCADSVCSCGPPNSTFVGASSMTPPPPPPPAILRPCSTLCRVNNESHFKTAVAFSVLPREAPPTSSSAVESTGCSYGSVDLGMWFIAINEWNLVAFWMEKTSKSMPSVYIHTYTYIYISIYFIYAW